jgi:hypothetical protein
MITTSTRADSLFKLFLVVLMHFEKGDKIG